MGNQDIKKDQTENMPGEAGKQSSVPGQDCQEDTFNPRKILNQLDNEQPLTGPQDSVQNQESGETKKGLNPKPGKPKNDAAESISDAMKRLDDLIRKIKERSKNGE